LKGISEGEPLNDTQPSDQEEYPVWDEELPTFDEALFDIDGNPVKYIDPAGQTHNVDGGVRVLIPVHHVKDATAVASMTEAIGRLPTAEESIHLWIGGTHTMSHMLGAILDLAAPATIDSLHVATFSFSKDNANEWAGYLDAGTVKSLTVITSKYFASTSTPLYQHGLDVLEPRGATIVSVRSHCKVIAAKLTDGRTVVTAGSANTRSAKSIEQVDITGHPEVYAFHVDQMKRCEAITGNQTHTN
jgi:hypothetical protein